MDVGNILNLGFGWLKWVVFILTIIVIGSGVFIWLSSIDEKINTGEAYGFTIGSSKAEIYETLPRSFYSTNSKKDVALFDVELYVKNKRMPITIKSKFDSDEFYLFEDKSKWKLFLDTFFFFDNLTLIFCNEKLCEIRRKRFYLELP
jgi:hypothetical protein